MGLNLSQIINKDENSVPSKLMLKNPTSETLVEVTAIKDLASGNYYMPVVNVGHIAYDSGQDKYKVDAREEAELLKTWSDDKYAQSQFIKYYGENDSIYSTTEIQPIDVSRYKNKLVVVKNNYNQMIKFKCIGLFSLDTFITSLDVNNIPNSFQINPEYIEIPVGGTYFMSSANNELIDLPYIGMVLEMNRGASIPTEGNMEIKFVGR